MICDDFLLTIRTATMEATSRLATFLCQTAQKVNLSARECWAVWVDLEAGAFCNASGVMVSDAFYPKYQ